jgi:hypothetical protein
MEQRSPNFIDRLTLKGKLLLLVTVVLFGGGFYFTVYRIMLNLPSGQYPLLYLFGPLAIWCVLFFLISARLLEHFGVRIYIARADDGKSRPAGDEKRPTDDRK